MNHLEKTEQKIVDNGYELYELKTLEIKCASICVRDNIGIFIDPSKFENSIDKRTALEHEFYHASNNLFYTFEDSLRKRKKQEFRANYEMACSLTPARELETLIGKGFTLNDLSEHFNLSESFIKEAIRVYKTKGLLK